MTQESPEVAPERYQRSGFMRDARRFRVVGDDGSVQAVGVSFPSGRALVEAVVDGFESVRLDVYPPEEGVRNLRDDLDDATIEFIDLSRRVREGDAVECRKCGGEVPLDKWTVYRHGGGACPLCGYETLPDRVRLSRDDLSGETYE